MNLQATTVELEAKVDQTKDYAYGGVYMEI